MTKRQLSWIWLGFKWSIACIVVWVCASFYYHRGRIDGEQGLGYWEGWQDAMIATDYGHKPYHD